MSKNPRNSPSSSPYQQLRKNRNIKIDIHPSSSASTSSTKERDSFSLDEPSPREASSSIPSGLLPSSASGTRQNVWIKPKNNAVQVPVEVLALLSDDIEKRHAGQLQAEEIVWFQAARPFRQAVRKSWATGLSLMLIIVSIFICTGIWLKAPHYLIGTALLPPIIAVVTCALLTKRIRVDLAGCYALTKTRADLMKKIIIVPRAHLGFLKPFIASFDFLVEKNLIMLQYQEARLQEKILTREPILADLVHDPHAIGTNSHAFELDFSDAMSNSPTPTGGGRLRIDKPDFEQQRKAARKFKLYPIIAAVWFIGILGIISGLIWGVFYTQTRSHETIAMVVLSWLFGCSLSVASFHPIYSIDRQKCESVANARYVRYVVDK